MVTGRQVGYVDAAHGGHTVQNKTVVSESELLAEAAKIAETLTKHAAEHDREASLPVEGIDAILASPINTSLHDGASWTAFAQIVGTLAKGDPSAATIWLMHQGASWLLKSLPNHDLAASFESKVRSGAWFGNALSEPTGGNLFLMPLQAAERVEGGWRLSGAKRFVSGCERAEHFLVNALCDGVPGFFLIDKDETIGIEDIWDTMGMRGTRSQLVHFNGTLLPEARRANVSMDAPNPIPVGLPWLSIGIAQAAMEFAIEYAKNRVIPVKNQPLSHLQWVQFAVADMAITLDAATALATRAATATDTRDPRAGILHFEAKVAANEAAAKIAASALKISGGTGYLKKHPIERHFRDAVSGQLMAWSTEVTRDFLGKLLLGLPPG
ncbi:MAG: acyl-CoA/acyl-ACP dehydrogenase [Polyangiaceae bacterium]|nr:acyl-CoA/acyl-ACP dehydrogenase [Polyangiaceae bacterium]